MLYGRWKVLGGVSLVSAGIVLLILCLCAHTALGSTGQGRSRRGVSKDIFLFPDNTAPDGSFTRALDGLRTLSNTMHDHSGINNPLDEWFTSMFGERKTLVISLLISLAVFTAILVTCGCCCIPCIRSLMVRLITTTIEGRAPPPYQERAPPPYQLLLRSTDPKPTSPGPTSYDDIASCEVI